MTIEQGNILVVDDNDNNRELLARRLRRRGHTVVTAADGLEGLESLQNQPFDLMVLDIMMPRMDGYEVLERLRANPALRHIPVIIISAVGELDSVVRCIELGAEDYLLKPFNPVLLHAKIDACLEKKRLRDREQSYLRSVEREMQLGQRAQADFLPAKLPALDGWNLAAAFRPARGVAGDFYDAFMLPDNRLMLVVADVCDKGVGAALFMALARTLVRAFAEESADPLQAIPLANRYIVQHHRQTSVFVTLFVGVVDLQTGAMSYINAGHLPPLLIPLEGPPRLLEPTGPAVGIFPQSQFAVEQVQIIAGDTVLAYTDGVTEARDRSGTLFGEEQLIELVLPPAPTLSELTQRVEAAVREHMGSGDLLDDITMLAVRRS